MNTRLYIKNELCCDLTQLQEQIRNLSYGSEEFSDILEYAMCGDMAAWLSEHGNEALSNKVESLDKTVGDTEFVTQLTDILLGKAASIKKPNYRGFFSCDKSTLPKNNKEVEVQLSLTPTSFVNENYEIKVTCGWGTKARVFNPSQYEEKIVCKETVTFHRRKDKKIGKIVVTIENEQVFEEAVQLPQVNPFSSTKSDSIFKRNELDDYIQFSAERVKHIVQSVHSQIEERHINIPSSTSLSPKETEYIRTAGGLIPKDEWLKRREQERSAREERLLREKEEAEREAMIERFRRKHGL